MYPKNGSSLDKDSEVIWILSGQFRGIADTKSSMQHSSSMGEEKPKHFPKLIKDTAKSAPNRDRFGIQRQCSFCEWPESPAIRTKKTAHQADFFENPRMIPSFRWKLKPLNFPTTCGAIQWCSHCVARRKSGDPYYGRRLLPQFLWLVQAVYITFPIQI